MEVGKRVDLRLKVWKEELRGNMKIDYGGNYFISYLVEVRFRWRDRDYLSAKLKRSQRDIEKCILK